MKTCTIEYAKAMAEKAKSHIDKAIELKQKQSEAYARRRSERDATDVLTDAWFTRKGCHDEEINTLQNAFDDEINNANAIIEELAETEIVDGMSESHYCQIIGRKNELRYCQIVGRGTRITPPSNEVEPVNQIEADFMKGSKA